VLYFQPDLSHSHGKNSNFVKTYQLPMRPRCAPPPPHRYVRGFWVLLLSIKDPFWVLANTKTQKYALIILIIFSHLGGKFFGFWNTWAWVNF
jgi:hypothetical protein